MLMAVLCLNSKAQIYQKITGYGHAWDRVRPDSVLHLPEIGDTLSLKTNITRPQIRVVGDSVWWYKGRWRNLSRGGSGGTDTTSLSNRINLKLNIADTSGMLTSYLRKGDTAAMLSAYARDANVVHKTGNETIRGEKTFRSALTTFNDNASGTAQVLFDTETGGNIGRLVWTGGGMFLRSGAGSYLSLGSNDSNDRLRIQPNGNVLIGTGVDSSTYGFQVNGLSQFRGIAKYGGNYGSLFDDRTLVTKRYVDSTIAAAPSGGVTSITAGTGLTGGTITTSGTIAADTTLLSTRARLQKSIDSIGVITSGAITGSGTVNYIPKFGTPTQLGNSAMYDSAGQITLYKNFIGIDRASANNYLGQKILVDGVSGYGLLVQQNDSVATGSQLSLKLRKGLLTNEKPRPGFGVGMEMQLQDDEGRWRRSAFIINRITDTTAANYASRFQFLMNHKDTNSYTQPFQIFSDSTIRVARLAGTGIRNVVANSNGDLIPGTGIDGIDTLTISTRDWRQKGIDSLAAVKLNISDTAAMLSPYSRTATVTAQLAGKLNISDTAAMLTPYVRQAGFGLTKSGQSLLMDTLTMSTRAWRQKGVDSVRSIAVLLTGNQTVAGNKIFTNDPTFQSTVNMNVGLRMLNSSDPGYNTWLRSKANEVNQPLYFPADTGTLATQRYVNNAVAGLGSGTVTSITAGTGLTGGTITTSGTVAADTSVLSTRAWRQKGLDSLARLELNISDTAAMLSPYVRAAGYGLSKSGQSLLADTLNVSTRAWRQKGIDSVTSLITARPSGSGTTNYVTKWTATGAIGSSQIYDDAGTGKVGIGTTSPNGKLGVVGTAATYITVTGGSGANQGAAFVIYKSNNSTSLLNIGDKAALVGGAPDTAVAFRAGANVPLIFEPNASESMRLNTNGTINMTSLAGSGTRMVTANASGQLATQAIPTSVDTSSLSTRINLKLNISDTSSMLSPYARTATVNASVSGKLNITDTSAMLTPYLRKADTTSMLSPYYRTATATAALGSKLNVSDTASMLSPYYRSATASTALAAKLNVSDTSGMLTPYLRKVDTSAMLSPYYRTATASAALAAKVNTSDTAAMLSPYYRSATASAALSGKVNVSDTSSMLSAYYRSATATAALALKVNISDTSAMLTPYLRKVDTTAMLSPYYRSATATAALAGKLNTSDTSTMLSPYYRSATATAALAAKVNVSDTSTMLGNYVRNAGYGLSKSGQSFLVDTAAMATRARVQKAVDSLQVNINAKGSGTVTSIASGYGLTGGTITSSGTFSVDTTLMATRAWEQKGDDSLAAIIATKGSGTITGSGTANYLPKLTSSTAIGNSVAYDNSGELLINTTSDAGDYKLQVAGEVYQTLGTTIAAASTLNAAISLRGNGRTSTSEFLIMQAGANNDAWVWNEANGALLFGTNNTATASISAAGTFRINGLAGSGTRMVVADANGDLSTQAIPSGGGSSVTFNRQTASYTLVASDVSKTVEMNVAAANNLTVPTNASASIPVGSTITITQYGAGRTTIVAASGVTIRSANGWLKLAAQYGAVTLIKVGTDEWYAFGALSA